MLPPTGAPSIQTSATGGERSATAENWKSIGEVVAGILGKCPSRQSVGDRSTRRLGFTHTGEFGRIGKQSVSILSTIDTQAASQLLANPHEVRERPSRQLGVNLQRDGWGSPGRAANRLPNVKRFHQQELVPIVEKPSGGGTVRGGHVFALCGVPLGPTEKIDDPKNFYTRTHSIQLSLSQRFAPPVGQARHLFKETFTSARADRVGGASWKHPPPQPDSAEHSKLRDCLGPFFKRATQEFETDFFNALNAEIKSANKAAKGEIQSLLPELTYHLCDTVSGPSPTVPTHIPDCVHLPEAKFANCPH